MGKKISIIVIIELVFAGIFMPLAFSQVSVSEDENLVITTYYPVPYGDYQEMRLYPSAEPRPCSDVNRGSMYFDEAKEQVMVCRAIGVSSYAWQPIALWGQDGTVVHTPDAAMKVGVGVNDVVNRDGREVKMEVAGSLAVDDIYIKSGTSTGWVSQRSDLVGASTSGNTMSCPSNYSLIQPASIPDLSTGVAIEYFLCVRSTKVETGLACTTEDCTLP